MAIAILRKMQSFSAFEYKYSEYSVSECLQTHVIKCIFAYFIDQNNLISWAIFQFFIVDINSGQRWK